MKAVTPAAATPDGTPDFRLSEGPKTSLVDPAQMRCAPDSLLLLLASHENTRYYNLNSGLGTITAAKLHAGQEGNANRYCSVERVILNVNSSSPPHLLASLLCGRRGAAIDGDIWFSIGIG